MSNTNIEAYNSSTDVGEKIAAVPSEIGSEGFQQKQSENPNINRPNRQDRLSFDHTHDNLSTGDLDFVVLLLAGFLNFLYHFFAEGQTGSNAADQTKRTSTVSSI